MTQPSQDPYFYTLPDLLFNDPTLGLQDIRLYMLIQSFEASKTKRCWATSTWFCTKLNVSPSTFKRAFRSLIQKGYITATYTEGTRILTTVKKLSTGGVRSDPHRVNNDPLGVKSDPKGGSDLTQGGGSVLTHTSKSYMSNTSECGTVQTQYQHTHIDLFCTENKTAFTKKFHGKAITIEQLANLAQEKCGKSIGGAEFLRFILTERADRYDNKCTERLSPEEEARRLESFRQYSIQQALKKFEEFNKSKNKPVSEDLID